MQLCQIIRLIVCCCCCVGKVAMNVMFNILYTSIVIEFTANNSSDLTSVLLIFFNLLHEVWSIQQRSHLWRIFNCVIFSQRNLLHLFSVQHLLIKPTCVKKPVVHICTDCLSHSHLHLKMCDPLLISTITSKTKWNTERNSSYRFSCERSYIASDLNCVGRKCDVAQALGLCSAEHSLCHQRKMKSAFTYQWSQSFFTGLPKTCSRLSHKTKRWWKEQKRCAGAKAQRWQRRKEESYRYKPVGKRISCYLWWRCCVVSNHFTLFIRNKWNC